jgi:hypothetical protein
MAARDAASRRSAAYRQSLHDGLARKVARMDLPVPMSSSAYVTVNVRADELPVASDQRRDGDVPVVPGNGCWSVAGVSAEVNVGRPTAAVTDDVCADPALTQTTAGLHPLLNLTGGRGRRAEYLDQFFTGQRDTVAKPG